MQESGDIFTPENAIKGGVLPQRSSLADTLKGELKNAQDNIDLLERELEHWHSIRRSASSGLESFNMDSPEPSLRGAY